MYHVDDTATIVDANITTAKTLIALLNGDGELAIVIIGAAKVVRRRRLIWW